MTASTTRKAKLSQVLLFEKEVFVSGKESYMLYHRSYM